MTTVSRQSLVVPVLSLIVALAGVLSPWLRHSQDVSLQMRELTLPQVRASFANLTPNLFDVWMAYAGEGGVNSATADRELRNTVGSLLPFMKDASSAAEVLGELQAYFDNAQAAANSSFNASDMYTAIKAFLEYVFNRGIADYLLPH